MSKEEIIGAMDACATELGRTPSVAEFRRMKLVTPKQIRKNFGSYARLIEASGREPLGQGYTTSMKSLFLDWARVVREQKKIPSLSDYALYGKFSNRPLIRRFAAWTQVPEGMLAYARAEGMEGEWEDVVKIITDRLELETRRATTSDSPTIMPLRPRAAMDATIYGKPMHAPMNCSPVNENGVIFAFGSVAKELGFSILHIQMAFPDCQALRQTAPERWQRVRIEFEYESRNFLTHMHEEEGCDLIVCWRHNWPECPLEVLALEKVMGI